MLCLLALPVMTYAQNAIVGPGFSGGWGGATCPTGNSNFLFLGPSGFGTSYIETVTANTTAPLNFRMGIEFGGTTSQITETIGLDTPITPGIAVNMDTNCTTSGSMILNVTDTYNYVFKTRDAGATPTGDLVVFEVQGDVRTVTNVTQSPAANENLLNGDVTVTATLDGALSNGQGVYLRYSNDQSFNNSTVVEMTNSSGNDYTAVIPAAVNVGGANISYYVFTSGDALTIDHADADFFTINLNNDGDNNYSYNVLACCFTANDGDFTIPATWVGGVPDANADLVIDHHVNFNVTNQYIANSVTVNNGASFTTAPDAVNESILTIRINGFITNNGTFNFESGKVVFWGAADVNGDNARFFNNVELQNIQDIIGVDFGSQSHIKGTLLISSSAFVDVGSPIYDEGSTLEYNSGTVYKRRSEWSNFGLTQTPLTNQGTPHHVIVRNTNLFLGSENPNNPAIMNGDLTINPTGIGGQVHLEDDTFSDPEINNMSHPLIVKGNFINNDRITLSDVAGGDLVVEGHYTDNGDVNFNGRAVIFQGGVDQELTGDASSGSYQMDVVRINKSSGEVILQQSTEINKTNDPLILSEEGILNINNHNLILGESGTASQITFNQNSAFKGSDTSSLTLKGAGNMGNLVFDDNENRVSNALGNIFLEKDSGSDVGFANPVYLKEGITLTSGVLNSNGNLVFVSDENKTAIVREVPQPIGGSISDDVVIERYFPLSNRSFRYISSSVNTATSSKPTIHENWQEGATDATTANPYTDPDFNRYPDFGTHITGTQGQVGDVDEATGFDMTQTGFKSLYTWNEGLQSWNEVTSTNQPSDILEVGKGYALMVRGDRSATLESNTEIGDNPATLRTTGTIITGDSSPTIDSSVEANEFVLVGNPYQARVNMTTILTNHSTDLNPNYMWIWDPNIGTIGGYAVVDLSDASVEDENGNPILPQDSGANQFLEPFQACFLEVIDENPPSLPVTPLITFVESAKRNDVEESLNNGTFSDEPSILNAIELELYRDANPTLFDAVRLRFSPNYSTNPTYEDARKFWNSTERIAILNQNYYLSIDKRNLSGVNDTIPLYLGNYQTQSYNLKLDVQLEDGQHAQLYDAYLDQSQDLQNGLNTYNFNVDSSIPASVDGFRFALVFNPQTLGSEAPLTENTFTVYPNPTAGELYLQASSAYVGQEATIRCFDSAGRQVFSTQFDQLQVQQAINLAGLSDGFYILEVQTAHQVMSFKIQLGN
jgi:hypothetical protein